MAAYNAERTMDEAIQSVLGQEGVSFEFLIGDDASTDGTWSRIVSYRSDPRVRARRFSIHRGPSPAWNSLIAIARAPFLSLCDADDFLLPGHLATASSFLDRSPSIGVVCAPRQCVDTQGKVVPLKDRPLSPQETWDLIRMGGAHGGSMFRREVLQRIGGYRETAGYADAYDLFLRLAETTQIKLLTGRPLYAYRIHPYPSGYYNGDYQRRTELERMAVREAIRRRYGLRVSW